MVRYLTALRPATSGSGAIGAVLGHGKALAQVRARQSIVGTVQCCYPRGHWQEVGFDMARNANVPCVTAGPVICIN